MEPANGDLFREAIAEHPDPDAAAAPADDAEVLEEPDDDFADVVPLAVDDDGLPVDPEEAKRRAAAEAPPPPPDDDAEPAERPEAAADNIIERFMDREPPYKVEPVIWPDQPPPREPSKTHEEALDRMEAAIHALDALADEKLRKIGLDPELDLMIPDTEEGLYS